MGGCRWVSRICVWGVRWMYVCVHSVITVFMCDGFSIQSMHLIHCNYVCVHVQSLMCTVQMWCA